MSKPGSVPGPVRIKPNKRGDLTDYRRAKRLQDHLNWSISKNSEGQSNWFASAFNSACGKRILPVDDSPAHTVITPLPDNPGDNPKGEP